MSQDKKNTIIKKYDDAKVLWIPDNKNDNDISSGLEVSAKDLDPEENWIRVEAVPPDDQGYFKIMNPETRLFLTGNEQLEIQKEINSKLWLIL